MALDWDLMARDWETITNPEPSFNCVQPFMNWQARFVVDGTVLDGAEAQFILYNTTASYTS